MKLSKRDSIVLGVGTLLLIVLIVMGQFVYLSPLKSELVTKKQSLENEQRLLEMSSKKKTVTASQTVQNSRELQKKIPVKPSEDAFILDLEKAETLSNSEIKSMSFSKDVDVTADNTQAAGTQNNGQQTNTANQYTTNPPAANQNTSGQQTTTNTTGAQANSATAAAPGLKKLTVNLTVESPSYEDFEKFVQVLESLTRIVVVESINYTGGPEITSLNQQNPKLSYTLTVSAFYMPTLADLAEELPNIDAPAPANKENPLSQFSDTTNSN
jgi:type IV pilus assembly protein PilO